MATPQIVWVRYALVMVFLLPVLWYRRAEHPFRTGQPGAHALRGIMIVASSILFVLALERLPLEQCTAIGFVSPFFVTALSVPFLGEKVGVRRWVAVALGFVGVLLILRPGGIAFQWSMLLPLLSSFCWAVRLIITRRMSGSEQALTIMLYSSLVGCLASAPLALPLWRPPDTTEWLMLIAIAAFSALGQYLVIHAFMMASASLLAPFSYSSIVWAVIVGLVVFGTFPDGPTLVGTLVLVAAGLYVWHRERVRATTRVAESAAPEREKAGERRDAGVDPARSPGT
jgi:drug/metabolite transporter (DMT)-like permease